MSNKPKRPKLRVTWSKREKDLVFHYPTAPDGHLLNVAFNHVLIDGKTLRQHLLDRGYDVTTLKLSVERHVTGKCEGGHAQRWNGTSWDPCRTCEIFGVR